MICTQSISLRFYICVPKTWSYCIQTSPLISLVDMQIFSMFFHHKTSQTNFYKYQYSKNEVWTSHIYCCLCLLNFHVVDFTFYIVEIVKIISVRSTFPVYSNTHIYLNITFLRAYSYIFVTLHILFMYYQGKSLQSKCFRLVPSK